MSGNRLIARPIGLIEAYSTSRHNFGFYRGVGQTARFSVPSASFTAGRSLESALEHAVAQTILSHPTLQVGIVDEDTRTPYFVYLPTLDLSQLIKWVHDEEGDGPSDRDAALQRVLEARHLALWPSLHQRPGYQFIVLCPDPANPTTSGTLTVDIVFAFHHGYGDGTSGTIVQRTLLRALNNPVPVPSFNPSTHILTIDSPSPLPPPQEAVINFKISWLFFLKTLWAEFAPSFLKPAPAEPTWTGKPISSFPENTRVRLVSFPTATLLDILRRCREKSTTLTPLLNVLVLHSLAKRVPELGASPLGLTCMTPISLRRLLPRGGEKGFDPDETIGVMVSGHLQRFGSDTVRQIRAHEVVDDKLVWDLVSSVGDEINRKAASLPDDDGIGMLKYVSDWHGRWRQTVGKERDTTWEVSNVGAVDFGGGEKGDWTVDRVVFSQSASVAGAAVSLSVAGVRGGGLAVTVCWQESIIDGEVADGLARDVAEWLAEFARTGRFGSKPLKLGVERILRTRSL